MHYEDKPYCFEYEDISIFPSITRDPCEDHRCDHWYNCTGRKKKNKWSWTITGKEEYSQ